MLFRSGSTLLTVDVGADLQVSRAGFERGRLDQLTIDAGVHGDVDEPGLEGQRCIAGGHGGTAPCEVKPDAYWHNQQADHEPDQKSHSVRPLLPRGIRNAALSGPEQDIASAEML